MHRAQTLRWLTVVLAGVMGTLVFAQSPTPISFANLPKGDTLHIRYSAWNCFLSEAAEFVYKGGKIGVFTVTESIPQPLNSEWVSLSRGLSFSIPMSLPNLMPFSNGTESLLTGILTCSESPISRCKSNNAEALVSSP